MFRADFLCFTSKIVEYSRYLPVSPRFNAQIPGDTRGAASLFHHLTVPPDQEREDRGGRPGIASFGHQDIANYQIRDTMRMSCNDGIDSRVLDAFGNGDDQPNPGDGRMAINHSGPEFAGEVPTLSPAAKRKVRPDRKVRRGIY